MPAAVQGEGAVRLLECTVVKECDAAGLCETASTQVMFRMEPVEIGTDGSGRYSLRYGDVEAAMDARSAAGPFFWTVGNNRGCSHHAGALQDLVGYDPHPHIKAPVAV